MQAAPVVQVRPMALRFPATFSGKRLDSASGVCAVGHYYYLPTVNG